MSNNIVANDSRGTEVRFSVKFRNFLKSVTNLGPTSVLIYVITMSVTLFSPRAGTSLIKIVGSVRGH
jgi:hypothetical protein